VGAGSDWATLSPCRGLSNHSRSTEINTDEQIRTCPECGSGDYVFGKKENPGEPRKNERRPSRPNLSAGPVGISGRSGWQRRNRVANAVRSTVRKKVIAMLRYVVNWFGNKSPKDEEHDFITYEEGNAFAARNRVRLIEFYSETRDNAEDYWKRLNVLNVFADPNK